MKTESSSVSPDSSPSAQPGPPSQTNASPQRKPRFALFIATSCGLGYLPKAPGTFGSLAGIVLALVPWWVFSGLMMAVVATKRGDGSFFVSFSMRSRDLFLWAQIILAILVAVIGIWSANRAAEFWRQKDPQRVVIDEVSGQHLALLIGCGVPIWWRFTGAPWTTFPLGLVTFRSALNWKYLLLGFILFRVFDIWKPFPARQAESLPGGWGIMCDDWVAGIYAALGLWVARAFGL